MKVETRDPWAFMRDNDKAIFNQAPRTRATFSYPPRTVVGMGWQLLWRGLWSMIRRHRGLDFWMEDDSTGV